MARVGNKNNLAAGDTYDVLFFDFQDGYPIGAINLGFGKNPKRISGVQKVSQVFTKCLLTTIGSDVMHDNYGSDFTKYSVGGNSAPSDANKVKYEIDAAVQSAAAQARGVLNVPGASLEAQLERASVISVGSSREGSDIRIQLMTRGGQNAPIAIPFTSLGLKVNA